MVSGLDFPTNPLILEDLQAMGAWSISKNFSHDRPIYKTISKTIMFHGFIPIQST